MKTCRIEGCGGRVGGSSGARGLCSGHYERWKKHGSAMENIPLRKLVKGGGICSECTAPAYARGLCVKHYNATRHTHAYPKCRARLIAKREGLLGRPRPDKCEVCNRVGGKQGIVFDHCHATGKPRGWLCSECNRGLGLIEDNPIVLRNLAEYVEAHK